MSEPLGARVHLSVTPSPAELQQARERLTRESCPRRYCWYWHTRAFDWDLSPEQGCEVAERHIHRLLLRKTQHHIYYQYVPGDSVLTVLSVWRCVRGAGPDLRKP